MIYIRTTRNEGVVTTLFNWKLRDFCEAVSDCQLIDLALEGHQFTWSKGRGTDDFKERKLDRAMATHEWMDVFPNYRL